jgi:hypothetical protein
MVSTRLPSPIMRVDEFVDNLNYAGFAIMRRMYEK